MTITEKLSKRRKDYWKGVIERTNQKLEKCLLGYQFDEEYVSKSYNVKLIVKYDEETLYCFKIYLIINDKLCDFDDGDCVETFKSDKAVRQYLDFLNLQLSDIDDEDYTVIMIHSDFSIEEMKDNEEVCILELELRLEVD